MKNIKTILIVFFLLLNLPFVSKAQDKQNITSPDSINVLVFQNKYNPEKIAILKVGKKIKLKLKNGNNVYAYKFTEQK